MCSVNVNRVIAVCRKFIAVYSVQKINWAFTAPSAICVLKRPSLKSVPCRKVDAAVFILAGRKEPWEEVASHRRQGLEGKCLNFEIERRFRKLAELGAHDLPKAPGPAFLNDLGTGAKGHK